MIASMLDQHWNGAVHAERRGADLSPPPPQPGEAPPRQGCDMKRLRHEPAAAVLPADRLHA